MVRFLTHGRLLHAPFDVLLDLQVEVPIPPLALRLGIEMGRAHKGLEFLELDVDRRMRSGGRRRFSMRNREPTLAFLAFDSMSGFFVVPPCITCQH